MRCKGNYAICVKTFMPCLLKIQQDLSIDGVYMLILWKVRAFLLDMTISVRHNILNSTT